MHTHTHTHPHTLQTEKHQQSNHTCFNELACSQGRNCPLQTQQTHTRSLTHPDQSLYIDQIL